MKWRENAAVKALAFTAAVAAFTATAIMGWYQLVNFDALWGDSFDYAGGRGYTQAYLIRRDFHHVEYLTRLYERRAAGGELTYADKRSIEQYEAEFDPGATNLRWQLLDQDGKVLYGNTREDCAKVDVDYWRDYDRSRDSQPAVNIDWAYLDNIAWKAALNFGEYDGECYDDRWREALPDAAAMAREYAAEGDPQDGSVQKFRVVENLDSMEVTLHTALADDNGYTNVLQVDAPDGTYVFVPTVAACLEANQFGYIFDPVSLEWQLSPEAEAAMEAEKESVSLVMWVDGALRVDDHYRKAYLQLEQWQANRMGYLACTIVCGVAGLLLLVYLCCGAGHKKGVEGVCLNWFHRVPGDVLLFLLLLGCVASVGFGVELAMDAYGDAPMYIQLICVGLAVAATAALGMGMLITICARCKAHTLLRNTWTWNLCRWCWKLFVSCLRKIVELGEGMGRAVQAIPLIWKAVLGCMAYTLFTIAAASCYWDGLWLLGTFLVSAYLCRWAYQWKKIRHGTQEIIGGNPSYHIDTRHMLPDLRGHADELNNLGHAISTAVDERMKSEHFKAELITNVSHDLKTPLTSIINYVDLLKKEDIQNPKAAEYIDVLDRKSQRLKKLTEDLVEASKASTGNLAVNWERLDWAQLTDQALAETGERLEAQKLTVVRSLPDQPLWVEADGRHLWRVLDNLLTNCAKYALPGTRVYVDLRESGGWAVLSVKNISRDALDIPAERLMERFVRGDESRNQAGSGLGLSIAQSLTELQHGRFDIVIDGDLFKAIVTLPLAGDLSQDPIQLIL